MTMLGDASRTWLFNRGEWTAIPDPFDRDGLPDDPAEVRRQLGYLPDASQSWGINEPIGVDVYRHESPSGNTAVAPYPFLVEMGVGDLGYTIFIADLPSLVMVLPQLIQMTWRDDAPYRPA